MTGKRTHNHKHTNRSNSFSNSIILAGDELSEFWMRECISSYSINQLEADMNIVDTN